MLSETTNGAWLIITNDIIKTYGGIIEINSNENCTIMAVVLR